MCATRSPTVNRWGVWGMFLLCNPILWQHQHTYAHHSHTNEFENDPDLHHFHTLIRVHKRFKKQSIYKLQSNIAYVIFAYGFVVFGTCIWIPWGVLKEGALYGIVEIMSQAPQDLGGGGGGPSSSNAYGMLSHVVLYSGLIIAVPFVVHTTWISAFLAIIVHMTTSGLLFALFSQINHLNEASISDTKNKKEKEKYKSHYDQDGNELYLRLESSWAVKQIETSNNFAPDSVLWHMLSNGLNLQIEHHLFPGINHCHLHHIVPVVQHACKDYGIQYKSYNSWYDIFNATLRWLDLLADASDDDEDDDCFKEEPERLIPKTSTTTNNDVLA